MTVDSEGAVDVAWEADVSLLTNPLVVRQLAFVVLGAGLMMVVLLGFIFIATGEFDAIVPMLQAALLTTAGFGLLLLLVTVLVFGGRIRVRFVIDEHGVLWETVDPRAVTANRFALLAGILARSPQAVGAGALARTRQRSMVSWSQVQGVEVDDRRRTLTLRDSWRPIMLVVCSPTTYPTVRALATHRVDASATGAGAPRRRWTPLRNALLRTVLVFVATWPLFALHASVWFDVDLLLPIVLLAFALATTWLIPLFGWVVLAAGAILAVQVAWVGVIDNSFRYPEEGALLVFTYLGLAYLAWFSWASLKGRIRPPLLED